MNCRPPAGGLLLATLLCGLTLATSAPAEEPEWNAPFAASATDLIELYEGLEMPEGEPIHFARSFTTIELDAQGRRTTRTHQIYRVTDESAVPSWDVTEASWNPGYQHRPVIRARVIGPDGSEYELDPATLSEQPVQSELPGVYSDQRSLVAPLPFVRVGSIIEVETIHADEEPYFAAGIAGRSYVGSGFTIEDLELAFRYDAALPFRWKALRGEIADPRERQDGSWTELHFDFGRVEAADWNAFFSTTPDSGVTVLGFSTGESWNAVSRGYEDIVDQTLQDYEASEKVRELIAQAETREERIEGLARHVRSDFRYTGLDLDNTGIVPRPPSKMDERGYGDCKDKAAYLTASLRHAGIEAHVALLLTAPDLPVDPELPGLGVFDHAIVRVPGEPGLWLDPTDEWTPVFEPPTWVQGRRALVVDEDTTGLTEIPRSTAEDNRDVEERILRVALDGTGSAVEICRPTGLVAGQYRSSFRSQGRSDYEEMLVEYGKRYYEAEEARIAELSGFEDPDEPVRLRLEMDDCQLLQTDQTSAAARLPTEELFADFASAGGGEPWDLELPAPFLDGLDYRVHYPPAFDVVQTPEDREASFGPVTVRVQCETVSPTELQVRLELRVDEPRVSGASAKALMDWAENEGLSSSILVTFEHRGEVALQGGRYADALEEFQRERDRYPDHALPSTRLARLYLELGLTETAGELVENAIEREKDSLVAHFTRGKILLHDDLGREELLPENREAAIESFRRAVEIDPENVLARANLSDVLAMGHDGEVGSEGADLEEAYQQLKELRAIEPRQAYDEIALDYAVRMGDLDRLARLSEGADLAESVAGAAKILHAMLSESGDDPTVLAPGLEPRGVAAEAFRLASAHLMALRRYPESAKLLRRATELDPDEENMVAVGTFLDILARTQRLEELVADRDRPAWPIYRILDLLRQGYDRSEDYEEVVVAKLRDTSWHESDFESITSVALETWESARGFSRDNITDLTAAMIEPRVEGDDDLVREVSLWMFHQKIDGVFFVMRADDGYRMVGNSMVPGGLGWLALEKLDDSDEEAARELLAIAHGTFEGEIPSHRLGLGGFARLWTLHEDEGVGSLEDSAWTCWLQFGSEESYEEVEELLDRRTFAAYPDVRDALAMDLYTNAARREDDRDIEESLDRLLAIEERDEDLNRALLRALGVQRRFDQQEALLRELLRVDPNEHYLVRYEADLAARRGEFERAVECLEKVVDSGSARTRDLNQMSWFALFTDRALAPYLRLLQYGQPESAAALHTLALLHACEGNLAEARRHAFASLEKADDEDDLLSYRLISAKMAEHLGKHEIARRIFAEIIEAKGDESHPYDSAALARRWLRDLDGRSR